MYLSSLPKAWPQHFEGWKKWGSPTNHDAHSGERSCWSNLFSRWLRVLSVSTRAVAIFARSEADETMPSTEVIRDVQQRDRRRRGAIGGKMGQPRDADTLPGHPLRPSSPCGPLRPGDPPLSSLTPETQPKRARDPTDHHRTTGNLNLFLSLADRLKGVYNFASHHNLRTRRYTPICKLQSGYKQDKYCRGSVLFCEMASETMQATIFLVPMVILHFVKL